MLQHARRCTGAARRCTALHGRACDGMVDPDCYENVTRMFARRDGMIGYVNSGVTLRKPHPHEAPLLSPEGCIYRIVYRSF